MATSSGKLPIGKLGNTVSYLLNGKMVTRTIGRSTKKRTVLQLAVMQKTKVTSIFLQPMMTYLKIGYAIEAARYNSNAQNQAFIYHWKNALKGRYPALEIDYEKVLTTMGALAMPENVATSMLEGGINFSWNPESTAASGHWTDQCMMIAYFPKLATVQFITAGANRHLGKDFLPVNLEKENTVMELYLSFISSDRQSISNSVYAGQLNW